MSERLSDKLKCDGGCENHVGDVIPVIISGGSFGKSLEFNYCLSAIAEDKNRGFTVKPCTPIDKAEKEGLLEAEENYKPVPPKSTTRYKVHKEHEQGVDEREAPNVSRPDEKILAICVKLHKAGKARGQGAEGDAIDPITAAKEIESYTAQARQQERERIVELLQKESYPAQNAVDNEGLNEPVIPLWKAINLIQNKDD